MKKMMLRADKSDRERERESHMNSLESERDI